MCRDGELDSSMGHDDMIKAASMRKKAGDHPITIHLAGKIRDPESGSCLAMQYFSAIRRHKSWTLHLSTLRNHDK